MPTQSTTWRSRRAVLAGAVAGAAALAAESLVRPAGVSAAGPIVMGAINNSATLTDLYCDSGGAFAGHAQETGAGLIGTTNDPNDAGVYGLAFLATGAGVRAANNHKDSHGHSDGIGLVVDGKVVLNRSGRATVAKGKASVTITVPGGLTGTPLLFGNLLTYRTGVAVAAVRPNYPSAGKARIYLTKQVGAATKVAWLVIG